MIYQKFFEKSLDKERAPWYNIDKKRDIHQGTPKGVKYNEEVYSSGSKHVACGA